MAVIRQRVRNPESRYSVRLIIKPDKKEGAVRKHGKNQT